MAKMMTQMDFLSKHVMVVVLRV
ncbi:hypothetical protein MTR67_031199 [Solanum verrucosum]|uniref:Uncharacterized protein n=1 Tax=Solanum verrucosum TaxID=315347 RepID=A0AAF0U220_SOLVR|nr:hypothetical protein MTR67_031199 [Solanum verrucosum]